MNEKQPKILVVRFSSLGDIVLSSPVYKNLKALNMSLTDLQESLRSIGRTPGH